MLRIIHLSDFHLNNQNIDDWETYIKKGLEDYLSEQHLVPEETFVVCSGDLIDKGGKEVGGVKKALALFKEKVIDVIVQTLGISIDHFMIVPGNHDIDRDKDNYRHHLGLIADFKNSGVASISKYARDILSGDWQDSKRMEDYKQFEYSLYENAKSYKKSPLGSCFTFEVSNKNICFACLNSAWLSYDNDDKKNGLCISEPQYNFVKSFLSKCDLKIAITHHPFDWLLFEEETIQKWIYDDFDLVLQGHVHKGDTSFTTKCYGSLFVDIAPCYTNDIHSSQTSFANGFTMLDYDFSNKSIKCSFLKYDLGRRKYVLNTEVVEGGQKEYLIGNKYSEALEDIMSESISYIKENHYPEINSLLIQQKSDSPLTLVDTFVMPPINRFGDNENIPSIFELMNNEANCVLFGGTDNGKTTLLHRLLIEYSAKIQQYDRIPVYINYLEIGNSDISKIIRDYIGCSSSQLKKLISAKKVIILLDNYNPEYGYEYQAKKIHSFVTENGIRIIATSTNNILGTLPNTFLSINKVAFEYFELGQFKAENINELMTKMSPGDESLLRTNKIEQMVSSFCSYSLPCTAMSVSLYLWSTQNAEKIPVNLSVLLDIYLDIVLEKLDTSNVYQNTFDFKNKSMLLAYIANDMLDFKNKEENKDKQYSYGLLIRAVETYLSTVDFSRFNASDIVNYFISHKIFVRKGTEISFAHSCFYFFFLAKRMLYNKEFYNFVTDEENYFKYERVINLYTGLARDDKQLLVQLTKRFESFFAGGQSIYENVNSDDFFTNIVRVENKSFVPTVSEINVSEVVSSKPSKETIEKKLLEVQDKRISAINDHFALNYRCTPDVLISLLSYSLRNLDGVEDKNLKQMAYNAIIKGSLLYGLISAHNLAVYVVTHEGHLPPVYSDVDNLAIFFRFIPYSIQKALFEFLGVTKLENCIKNKLLEDYKENRSDVEKFLSLGLLWDISKFSNEKEMKQYIASVGNNVTQDYLLLKLYHYFTYRCIKGSEEETKYIKLLSKLSTKNTLFPGIASRIKYKQLIELKDTKNKLN